ncbi:unnamed protein product, partial [Mycena citricolor]
METLGKPNPESYNSLNVYSEAKTANVLTAAELSRRSNGQINGYSLHPGIILTNMNDKEEIKVIQKELGILLPDGTPNLDMMKWKTIPQGAATTVTAAFDPRLDSLPG